MSIAKEMILKYRRPIIILFHFCLIAAAYFFAFALRFDLNIPKEYITIFFKTLPVLIIAKLAVFYYFGIFEGLWRYVGMDDLWQIIKANCAATAVFFAGEVLMHGLQGFPRSVFIVDFVMCTSMISGVRFFTRLFRERYKPAGSKKQKKVVIVGAGEAGILALKEYRNNPGAGEVVGFIDDDPVKHNATIRGVKILGGRIKIGDIIDRYGVEEIVLAIPSAKGEVVRDILSYCEMPNVKVKIIPGIQKILNGELQVKPRDVKPEDLLGRETVVIDKSEISHYIKDKKVLVTGAGGSIGSEICRQIVHFKPKEIVLFDHNENDVYFLVIEFKTKYPKINVKTVIGDIGDVGLLKQTFSRYRPQIVFHAAAHKHVPLMEENPSAAVKNNVIGSRNLIYAANHYGAERFVLISTDKAVNPINVMGMSKRIAEMILQAKSATSKTKFMAVRFGNVIGSAGSAIPLFKKQIEEGGPLTITHREAERYFMSVSEAALLVLQAGAIGKGGELFILDMGEQIKMLEIAKNLVALSGLVIYKDIDVKFIGLRPGEKLSEELLLDKEKDKVTKHQKIYMSRSEKFNSAKLHSEVKELARLANIMDDAKIVSKMKELVNT
ncbi:MAG: nucleoside-diphosphate sugar epimerase/dehydratase [Candidatus Omnitrophica bacterium]|nr:nucleoside-diphosphate sugar epimerase/dehydratase [Candidatus Omnitrophota bacterium]